MAVSTLLPLAGAALAPAVSRVVKDIGEGLSFLSELHRHEAPPPAEPDTATVGSADTLHERAVKLSDALRERFRRVGIDLTTPVRLKSDGRDGVVVDGDHPDRVLVERIANQDEELRREFAELAAASERDQSELAAGVRREFRLVIERSPDAVAFE